MQGYFFGKLIFLLKIPEFRHELGLVHVCRSRFCLVDGLIGSYSQTNGIGSSEIYRLGIGQIGEILSNQMVEILNCLFEPVTSSRWNLTPEVDHLWHHSAHHAQDPTVARDITTPKTE